MRRITGITLLLLIVAAAAIAQPAPPPPGARLPHDPLPGHLALTDAQQAAWRDAHDAAREAIQPLAEKQRATHEQLRTAIDSGSKDAAAIGTLMLSIHATGDQIKARHDALRAKLVSILTAEQKVKFEAFQAVREAGRERGHGPFAGMGPMPGRGPMPGAAPPPGRGPGF